MAAKATLYGTDVLKLILNGTAFATAQLARDSGTPVTNLYLSLHTSSPGAAGDQTTNEVTVGAYGQYARQAVARTSAGFTVGTASATLTSAISWTVMSTGTGNVTATYFGVGTASSGAGYLLYFGPITPNILINNGVIPQLTTGTTITET